ncbi:TatD family hydrolase [Candidatus Nitronereus thalassa]|uniref:TatD family hydrolase n=1 Tax=Candidatus Nitronereus thalassa TaxID=3020898 RepID=A0ABU3K4C1_9BACT|nr:TatD family hydrolase [Candidatus Nitronereus thalassa]MDT7041250.1 TatD family hydrolase [Candidatus Nitronereus thalassa]
MLIDSHVHLDDPRYDQDRDAVFQRAQEAGVEAFVTIGCDLSTSQSAAALADFHENVFATIGVHPHESKEIVDGWYDEFRRLAQHPKVVAYGEIGLDYHYDHSPRVTQRLRFREQIQLAKELQLPMVIHTREAQEDTISILKEEGAADVGGVFHCFSGDAWLAKDALDLGFYLSFSGVITFKNATMLRDIIKTVPLDRMMVETDCPYLTPVPYRGKRNEPAFVRQVAETISTLVESDTLNALEKVSQATVENTKRLFKIP